jgi:K+-sensing histidine kinase KdpD
MSKKVKDDKNRWRNKIVAFRMSPEENEELDRRYRLLGYRTKQDYIIEAVLKGKVTAMGNMQMIYQFRRSLEEILSELQRLKTCEEMSEDLMTPIRTMLEIMEAIKEKDESKSEKARIPKLQYDQMMHLKRLKKLLSTKTEDETHG